MTSPRRKSPNIVTDLSYEMERYFKYFFYKTAQVVVQSRQGEKMCTISSPVSNLRAWFTLSIHDIQDINYEAKRVIQPYLNTAQGILITPLCIEISLKTSEGDSMVLETWVITLKDHLDESESSGDEEQSKTSAKVTYNQMGMLMKSIICVARSLPAYKLSRSQGPESFVICYRIYSGEPIQNLLGKNPLSCPIGHVSTPSGVLQVRVDYRAADAMTIEPSSRVSSDNYGINPIVGKADNDNQNVHGYYRGRSDTLGSRISDDSENFLTSDESSELRIFPSSPSDPPILRDKRKFIDDESFSDRIRHGAFSSKRSSAKSGSSQSIASQGNTSQDKTEEDHLFQLFTVDPDDSGERSRTASTTSGGTSSEAKNLESKLSGLAINQPSQQKQQQQKQPSLPMDSSFLRRTKSAEVSMAAASKKESDYVDFKLPFSAKSSEINSNDLGVFFKDVLPATMALRTIDEEESHQHHSQGPEEPVEEAEDIEENKHEHVQQQLMDINEQLSQFESNLAEYDEMLKTLETSESESDLF